MAKREKKVKEEKRLKSVSEIRTGKLEDLLWGNQ